MLCPPASCVAISQPLLAPGQWGRGTSAVGGALGDRSSQTQDVPRLYLLVVGCREGAGFSFQTALIPLWAFLASA